MAGGIGKLRGALDSVKGAVRTEGKQSKEAAPAGAEADVQKLTRLELLEILVEQKKEIARLKEQLEETQERLARDDELIKKFLGGGRPELKVRRDV